VIALPSKLTDRKLQGHWFLHVGCDPVLVEGSLLSTKYERKPDEDKKTRRGKSDKPAKGVTLTLWNIRATTFRKLNRSEQTPELAATPAGSSDPAEPDATAF
jgi:hypothetical protein